MLGSPTEADDAVQECWLRLHRTDTSDVHNLRAWLTTVVGRVCLDMLRSRTARREEPLDVEPVAPSTPSDPSHPEQEAPLAHPAGPALLIALDTLVPAEPIA